MKALVVYESMYGNTAAVASAIADGIASSGIGAVCLPAGRVGREAVRGADLLVVGGPTHAHGMSRSATRESAASDKDNTFDMPTLTPGLREWLEDLPDGEGRLAAAFDTRIDKPAVLTGSAAKGIARRLDRRGFRVVADPESFFVTTKNHLVDEEIEHGMRWGSHIASSVVSGSRSR